jgi:hypothetical protein
MISVLSLPSVDQLFFLDCLIDILNKSPKSADTSLPIPFLMEIMNLTTSTQQAMMLSPILLILYDHIKKYPTLLLSSDFSSLFVSSLSKMIQHKQFMLQHGTIFLVFVFGILTNVVKDREILRSFPFIVQRFHEEGMVDEIISLSSSSNPKIAAYSIMILIFLDYKREWVEREIYINRLIEFSPFVDSYTQQHISSGLSYLI